MPRLHYPSGQRCERAAGAAPIPSGCPLRLCRHGISIRVGDGSTPARFVPASVFPPLVGSFFGALQVVHESD